MKYQSRIHKAFADKLDKDNGDAAKQAYQSAIEQYPQLRDVVSVEHFESKEVSALRKSNAEICIYFACESEYADNLEAEFPAELRRFLYQTVQANVNAYKNILEVLQHEPDGEYLKVYKNLFNGYERYFELAVEDILADVYGEQYTSFADEFTEDFAAKAKEAAAKRGANKASKNA